MSLYDFDENITDDMMVALNVSLREVEKYNKPSIAGPMRMRDQNTVISIPEDAIALNSF